MYFTFKKCCASSCLQKATLEKSLQKIWILANLKTTSSEQVKGVTTHFGLAKAVKFSKHSCVLIVS